MLLTKINIPSAGKNIVQRTALYKKLNEGLNRKLILISAPAGFGKTTIVCDWLKQYKIQASWFSIDNNDNDVGGFLNYLITSIQHTHKDIGHRALELLASPTPPGPESIINFLINDIVGIDESNLLLVLDDFHLIDNNEILNAIGYLIEYLPPNLHLAIISRSDPNLSVAKLRSQHQLVEIRAQDLNFTANDISVLFNRNLKTGLSIENIKKLEKKTEGWIAGLQLAALSMQGYSDSSEFIDAFAGNNRYIMDYLIEEVLKTLSEGTKEFLLKTSILEQFSAPLCNAILDKTNSQIEIEELENNNMFVFPLDSERQWYRYHHLFADLLKQKLQVLNDVNIEELHRKASVWFEINNMVELAIEHLLLIKDYEKVTNLLDTVIEDMWRNGQHEAILKYGDVLPNIIIEKHINFSLYYSWVLIASGQSKKAQPLLLSAENIAKNNINSTNLEKVLLSKNQKLLGKISVALAYLHSHQEHSEETFSYCNNAIKYLTEEDPFWFSWAWFSFAISYFALGNLDKSKKAFDKAYEYSLKSGNIYLVSTVVIRMAEIEQQLGDYKSAYKRCTDLLELINKRGFSGLTEAEWTYTGLYFIMGVSQFTWADLEPALESIKKAYSLSIGMKDVYLKTLTLMVYSFVLKELNDPDAQNRMNELEELVTQNEVPPFMKSMYIGWKMYLLYDQGYLDKAHDVAVEYGIKLSAEKTIHDETAYACLARLFLLQNKLTEAKQLIDELYSSAETTGRIERLMELEILYAIYYNIINDKNKAIEYILRAMEAGSPQNLVSYFVFNTALFDNILHETIRLVEKGGAITKNYKIPKGFIRRLTTAIQQKKKVFSVKPDIELSSRELDTLKLIGEELTNQEIADKLFISLNTVKTHLKNIYLKLEVDSRGKAVEKGKELGVL